MDTEDIKRLGQLDQSAVEKTKGAAIRFLNRHLDNIDALWETQPSHADSVISGLINFLDNCAGMTAKGTHPEIATLEPKAIDTEFLNKLRKGGSQ